MYPKPIQSYQRPETLHDALKAAAASSDAIFIAGGMSLMQAMKSRLVQAEHLIDLNGVDELRGIAKTGASLLIGAMTRYRDLAAASDLAPFQAVTDAARHIGDRQVRNRGTLGGSLSWNYVNACMPIVALALDAKLAISGQSAAREIGIEEFQKGPLSTDLGPGEILTSIRLDAPAAKSGSAYCKWGVVHDALPVIGVGVQVEMDGDRVVGGRFAVGGLPNGAARSAAAEAQMTEGFAHDDAQAVAACAAAAADELETESDAWISAEYKSELIMRLGCDRLETAIKRALGG